MDWLEDFTQRFVETYKAPFTVKEFSRALNGAGFDIDDQEIEIFLESNPFIFALKKGKYLTHSAAFKNYLFSFKPSKKEVDEGVFFLGHRGMPVLNTEFLQDEISVCYRNKRLHKEFKTFCSKLVEDHYMLFGEEYVTQYIADDPANFDIDIAKYDYELPKNIKQTCFSLKPLIEKDKFKYGDRILCRLVDWSKGIIEVYTLHDLRKSPFEPENERRIAWYKALEAELLKSFDLLGPCSSICEQLANVFFERRNELSIFECGSVEEFLNWTKKISFEYYGVETRLWKKGEEIPAVGKWNYTANSYIQDSDLISVPDFIVDNFILDCIHKDSNTLKDIPDFLFPKQIRFSKEDRDNLLLQIETRSVILKKSYNRFSDFQAVSVRHRALELYKNVITLLYDIDSLRDNLCYLPQQELVILSQLFTHVSRILQTLAPCGITPSDIGSMDVALEGMEYNFEDIDELLSGAVAELKKKSYTIV